MADNGDSDIRLEAAVAKMWNSEEGWKIADRTLQIRGGRGYETADSLRSRGEPGIPVERMMRDYRINLIFEGSSEIMRLFIAREALDRHLAAAGDVVNPKAPFGRKLAALPKMLAFYAWWYPTRWLGWGRCFSAYRRGPRPVPGRTTRRLSRAIFHMMAANGPKLEKRQALLFRAVDIGADLFATAAAVSRAHGMRRSGKPEAGKAVELAHTFSRMMRRRIADHFRAIRSNDDVAKYKTARKVLDGEFAFLEEGLAQAAELDLRPALARTKQEERELAPV